MVAWHPGVAAPAAPTEWSPAERRITVPAEPSYLVPAESASEESAVPVIHFQPDTLPRVERDPGGARVDLVLPFRFTVDIPDPATTWVLRARVNGNACEGIAPTTVTRALVQSLRDAMQRDGMFDFDRLAPYLAMEKHLDSASYVEYRVPGIQPGVHVTYVLEPADPQAGSPTSTYGIYALAPEFGRADIRRIHADDVMHPEGAWVLYHQRATSLHHVRIDVATLVQDPDTNLRDNGIADLVVTIGDHTVDLRDTRITELPIVDLAADSVVVTVPADGDAPLGPVTVRYLGQPGVEVDPNATVDVGRARAMFVNFAIQGLNDYFVKPDELYTPARTYTQVTMRDEKATFSSRPGSPENPKDPVGDGYAFTLQAHRRYGIKQMWAMNGGLAVLLAHDCPDDLEALRRDVASGLVQPVVAGFGAHRVPYYATATNVDAIRYGIDILDGILGAHSLVYYPDSRIYAKRICSKSGMRAILPSSFMTSQMTPDGLRPASRATIDRGFVWPARASTPPSTPDQRAACLARRCRSARIRATSIATATVRARSCAEMPVVMPSRASIDAVQTQ